jgi:hypothetical protein
MAGKFVSALILVEMFRFGIVLRLPWNTLFR